MMQPKTIVVVASVALIVAGVFLWREIQPLTGSFDQAPHVGVGQVLAEEVAKAVPAHGRIVAVITSDQQEPGNPSHIEWETFCNELKRYPAINLVATETIQPDPNEGVLGCSSAMFRDILDRHAQADAIVFFTRLPDWRWLQKKGPLPKAVTAKIIVLADSTVSPNNQYSGYFASGILSALIIRRQENGPGQVANPKTPREWFQSEYQVFTPQNYESLPE